MCFATLPLFAKVAYADDVEPMALLAWRFGIAAVLLWLLTVLRGRRRPGPLVADRRLALRLVAIGAFLLTAEGVA